MDKKQIDVLAVLDEAVKNAESHVGPTDVDIDAMRAASAAVAELIEAADELKDVCNRPSAARTRAESWRRLDRALSCVRSS